MIDGGWWGWKSKCPYQKQKGLSETTRKSATAHLDITKYKVQTVVQKAQVYQATRYESTLARLTCIALHTR